MRAIATLIIIVIALSPSLFAGLPSVAPAWFAERHFGAPSSVIVMCVLLALLVVLAAVCSMLARSDRGAE